jgi:hypothetical protein
MRFRTTHLLLLMTLVAVLSTVVVVFKFSGNAAMIAFGIWAVVFSFIVMGETKRD